jgi:hypothetical protein
LFLRRYIIMSKKRDQRDVDGNAPHRPLSARIRR